jgi:CheY-like chemotaxis protein
MQGSLQVRSTPGVGSTFTLALPGADQPAPAARPPPAPALQPVPAAASAVPRRVLYTEDNPVNVALMRDLLRRQPNVELQVAEDGPSALGLAARWQPHLVLLDLGLPGMSGIEVLRRLRADPATADIPCAAVSAFALGPDIQNAIDEGCVAYLTKPFRIDDLTALIERHAR